MTFDRKPTDREINNWLYEIMQETYNKDSFKTCAEHYIINRVNVLSPASIRTYNTMIKVMSEEFLRKQIFQMTQEDVQTEINRYAADHAPKTVRSLHGFISAVFGSYRPSFTLSTTLPQKTIKRPYRPDKDVVGRILEYERGTEYYIPFKLGALGLRRGEICALNDSDLKGNLLYVTKTKVYDGKNWIIKENPKTDQSNRIIPLSEQLVSEIEQYGLGFAGCPKRLNNELHRAQTKLGIEHFTFHFLRHYFASFASTLGLPESDVMSLGGWKSDFVFKSLYRESMAGSVEKSASKIMKSIF